MGSIRLEHDDRPGSYVLRAVSLLWLAVLGGLLVVFVTLVPLLPFPSGGDLETGRSVDAVPLLMIQFVGAVISVVVILRRPRNPVGWLLMVMSTGFFAYGYASLLAVRWAATAPNWTALLEGSRSYFWLSTFMGATWLLLVFPDGHPALARLASHRMAGHRRPCRRHPGRGGDPVADHPQSDQRVQVAVGGFAGDRGAGRCGHGGAGDRLRRVGGAWRSSDEALQLKWVVVGFGLTTGWALGTTAVSPLLGRSSVSPWLGALAALPRSIAIAVAILRYRLYAIDRIISRTVPTCC